MVSYKSSKDNSSKPNKTPLFNWCAELGLMYVQFVPHHSYKD
nr:MAG TPA: hypothetical protein [Caudoviricetes sp.]